MRNATQGALRQLHSQEMTHLAQLPGLKADAQVDETTARSFAANGYKWINFQAQNGTNIIDYDLVPSKRAGLLTGVWGVSYDQQHFYRDGKNLALQAKKLGAEHLTMDIEMALKGTRATRGAKEVIRGCRDGGWTGAIHLNTLAAPDGHMVNDYEYDLESFLETGGGVFAQCYLNMHYGFHPKNAREYYVDRLKVPAERFNATVSLAYSEPYAPRPSLRIAGPEWVTILRYSGVGANHSIFKANSVMPGDLEALSVLAKLTPEPTPTPTPTRPTALQTRAEVVATVDKWRTGAVAPTSRLEVIRRVAGAANTDQKWNKIKQRIHEILQQESL